ncbi:hypothetical protein SRABI106_04805 [Rahnella aquatilis]|nr:hypothetical protein SRABI106_04805 [Rahnella aquatilis]
MLIQGQRQNGTRCGTANAGQRKNFIKGCWKYAAVLADDSLCRFMQVSCAGVVTQPGPQMQYFIEWRGGEIRHRRETFHKAFKIRDDSRYLRLLQHHFRKPDFIGGFCDLPGQRFAAIALIPVEHQRRKTFCFHKTRGFHHG